MLTTTLKEIRSYQPCESGWKKLLKYVGNIDENKSISFKTILDAVGIEDAIWCLRTQKYIDVCLFCADLAESVLLLFEKQYPQDSRPRDAILAIRQYHSNIIASKELHTAAAVADTAAAAAYAASAAAYVADAAYAAASAAAYAADAAYAAASAAYAAAAVADTAAAAAALAGKQHWEKIEQLFIKHFGESKC